MICKTCSADFEPRLETKGRRRLHCYTCRPPRLKRKALWRGLDLRRWLDLWRGR